MKKLLCLVLIIALTVVFSSCKKSKSVNETTSEITQTETQSENSNIIDLTKLSETMVYSEVYNIITNPDKYIGKTVKMRGKYGVYSGEGRKNYVCEIQDATACCTQGLEFVLADESGYPEFDPEAPVNIEVIGTLNTYTEDGQSYVQLEDASVRLVM